MSGKAGFNLSSEDELQLVEGLSALPQDRLVPALDALCIPIPTPLQEVVTGAQQAGSSQQSTSNQYTVHIDWVANIFRYGSEHEPLADVFRQMWPLLKAVFMQRATDIRTMEKLCRTCKYAVRTCGRALGGVMGSMLEEVQERCRQHHHSCSLYLVTSFSVVPRGAEGAVRLEGTMAGLVASVILAAVACFIKLTDQSGAIICVLVGQVASFCESYIGAALQGREGFEWITCRSQMTSPGLPTSQ